MLSVASVSFDQMVNIALSAYIVLSFIIIAVVLYALMKMAQINSAVIAEILSYKLFEQDKVMQGGAILKHSDNHTNSKSPVKKQNIADKLHQSRKKKEQKQTDDKSKNQPKNQQKYPKGAVRVSHRTP